MTIWVEQLGPRQRVLNRSRFDAQTIRIGRAYAGDMVIDEPEAGAAHLLVRREADGSLFALADDGLHFHIVGDRRKRIEQAALTPDTVIRIGKSLLRFRTIHDIATPQASALPNASLGARIASALGAVLPLVLALVLTALDQWRATHDGTPFAHTLVGTVPALLLVLPWIAGWALTSRVISHQGHTLRHIRITGLGMLGLLAINSGIPLLAFAFGWSPSEHTEGVLNIVLASLVFGAHILATGEDRRMLRSAAVGGLLAIGIGGAFLFNSSLSSERLAIPHSVPLAPPLLRIGAPESVDAATSAFAALEAKAAASRLDPLPNRGN